VIIRSVCDDDTQDLLGLIAMCFSQYPGCYLDTHEDMPDLVKPTHSRLAKEGSFLVVEDEKGRVCACIGVDFLQPRVAELHRLYVRPDMRGRGLGQILTDRMERFAVERGADQMVLWTDTRFAYAHQLYRKLGYVEGSATRSLGDVSNTSELHFIKELSDASNSD
jgi:putative acetyltransferase